MTIREIQNQLVKYQTSGKKMFVTSSFQTHSIPLLHLLSTTKIDIDVLFINTGHHFPETLVFKEKIVKLLGLNVREVKPLPNQKQININGQLYSEIDPNYCCLVNKIKPLEPYLEQYDIWISGVRADQSPVRRKMKTVQTTRYHAIRFHPILNWSPKIISEYRELYNLPENPLDKKGYNSIGCLPCTKKSEPSSDPRSSRWFGTDKEECGLHTDLISV